MMDFNFFSNVTRRINANKTEKYKYKVITTHSPYYTQAPASSFHAKSTGWASAQNRRFAAMPHVLN